MLTNEIRKDTVDVDELLTLKSLVLANETTKQNLQEIVTTDGPNQGTPGDLTTNGVAQEAYETGNLLCPDTSNNNDSLSKEQDDVVQTRNVPTSKMDVRLAPVLPSRQSRFWSRTDQLEFAAQQLHLAKWEYERLEANFALRLDTQSKESTKNKQEFLTQKLRADMIKFGISDTLVELAINVLESNEDGLPERTAIYHNFVASDKIVEGMLANGLGTKVNEVNGVSVETLPF
jgi:hypothetical protein